MMEIDDKENWFIDFYNKDVGEITLTKDVKYAADIIYRLVKPVKNDKLLDLCCGKGYLAQELAQRGLNVIGVDLSKKYIRYARSNYQQSNCLFILDNAETFRLKNPADIVINWHTSMAYSQFDEKNKLMLKSIADNLKVGGSFIISTMNPYFVKKYFQKFIVKYIPYQNSNIITIRESFIEGKMLKSNWLFVYPSGKRKTAYGQTKMYTASDFFKMLKNVGLQIENIFSDNLQPYNKNLPTMIFVGKKISI